MKSGRAEPAAQISQLPGWDVGPSLRRRQGLLQRLFRAGGIVRLQQRPGQLAVNVEVELVIPLPPLELMLKVAATVWLELIDLAISVVVICFGP